MMNKSLELLLSGQTLSRSDSQRLFSSLLIEEEETDELVLAAVLAALRVRGEQEAEVAGAVDALSAAVVHPVVAPAKAIDIVGTGGDGLGLFNISTATAFVVASCGVPVAKHGNRGVSSLSGAADVLEALGIRIDAPVERLQQSLDEACFCFMFAPRHHPAIGRASRVRKALGTRTLFNLLGPLLNPAGVRRGLFGVADLRTAHLYSRVMDLLKFEHAWIVHGAGGADEMTLCGESQAFIVERDSAGMRKKRALLPEDAGLVERDLSLVLGGDAKHNARAILRVFDNKGSKEGSSERALLETILYNAAAALVVAGAARTLLEGATLARAAIEEGKTRRTLDAVKDITQQGS